MRLWSLAPRYLDGPGLVAVWREGLLARAVLMDQTHGYRSHPQLDRFKTQTDPLAAVNYYLEIIFQESRQRQYHFDSGKIFLGVHPTINPVTEGQLRFEMAHLQSKLQKRNASQIQFLPQNQLADLHPLFYLIPGPVEAWEKV